MIPSEYKPLVNKLISVTDKGIRNWSVTSDDSKFTMDIGINGVMIRYFTAWAGYDEMEENVVRLEIINSNGEVVDGFSVGENDGGFNEIYSLYEKARRNALRIDKTISDLIRDLDL